MLDICICTHNPRPDILALTIESIAKQDAPKGAYRIFLVDNASCPKLENSLLLPATKAGIEAKILYEPTPGLQRARVCAINATSNDWMLWVDDDNELASDFVSKGLAFIAKTQNLGCFGGKLTLPAHLTPKKWVIPFLPYLGIKDNGDELITGSSDTWGPWEPAGAGAWVHRKVLEEYLRRANSDDFFKLGRTGKSNLASSDDSFMMRTACRVGLSCAYVPELRLLHHLSPHRFNFKYLSKLMYAYGTSHVILEAFLRGYHHAPEWYSTPMKLFNAIKYNFKRDRRQSFAFAVAQAGYHIACYKEHKKQTREHLTRNVIDC